MFRKARSTRPSPATAIALLALFVALGGTATALTGHNTVFSDDIAPKAVQRSDLATDAVTGTKVKETSLRGIGSGVGGGTYDSPAAAGGGGAEVSPFGQTTAAGGDLALAPVTFKARDLQVRSTTPIPAGGHHTFTLFVDGIATGLACTVQAGDRTCSTPSGDTARVGVGQDYEFQDSYVDSFGSRMVFGWRAVTP